MSVIKEANNTERKIRWAAKNDKSEEKRTRTQRAKAPISMIKRGEIRKEDISRRVELIFRKGSWQEVENATANEKFIERITELSKREEAFDEWEEMRCEAKRRRREDRRLNIFWMKNKCFPKQFGGDEQTPDAEETLMFWRSINNKDVSEG